MKSLIVQGITVEEFFSNIEAIFAEKANQVNTTSVGEILARYIPELNTDQAAGLLGCSTSHLKNALLERYPEFLQPIIRGQQTIRYPTRKIWQLREKLEIEKRRKPVLSK